MKTFSFLILTFFLGIYVTAQTPQSFRYQAVARDNSGNILANQPVSFRMSILSGSVMGKAVYSEIQFGLTNAFGLVEIEIGKGTPVTGTFSAINWDSNSFFVKIEMDPAGGIAYQPLFTSQLLSVPYALHSRTVEQIPDKSVTSSKIAQMEATSGQVLKWNGTLWEPAADLTGGDATWSATGSHIYYNTGNVGIGIGVPTALLHTNGIGTGEGNVLFTGYYKTSSPGDPPVSGVGTRMMWYPDKAAFRVGRVWGDQWNKDSIGDYSVAMGENTKAKGWCSFAMGRETIASGWYSAAMGVNTTSSGLYSIAMGFSTTASAHTSTAMGARTTASGHTSNAMGSATTASGHYSTAMGAWTTASGWYSTAMGAYTTAPSYLETVIGCYNWDYIPMNTTGWNENDRLFVIGNGTNNNARSNALTVLKNGNIGIGTSAPSTKLHIKPGNWDLVNTDGDFLIGDYHHKLKISTANSGDRAGIARINSMSSGASQSVRIGTGGNDILIVYGNNVGINVTSPTQNLDVNGNARFRSIASDAYYGVLNRKSDGTLTTSTSDIRLKENIENLRNSLDKVMQLQGVSFTWKSNPEYGTRIGFIAQEMEKVIPELVFTNDVDGYKGINYAEVTAVLVEAIKELKTENDRLKAENEEINSRLEKIEALTGNSAEKY
jgi:hypothetical protein